MKQTKLQKTLIGPAGEHYVLFRLYQQGILASLAPPGTARVDILVLSTDERVAATLQVKTRTRRAANIGWVMGVKDEAILDEHAFYALVDLAPDKPVTYIVPSRVVADVLGKSHKAWLALLGKNRQAHRDNPVRRLRAVLNPSIPGYGPGWLDQYRERWQLLRGAVGDFDSESRTP